MTKPQIIKANFHVKCTEGIKRETNHTPIALYPKAMTKLNKISSIIILTSQSMVLASLI